MKKKVLAGIACAAMLVGMLSGCGQEQVADYQVELPTEAVEASIYVEPIPEMSDDFIKGVDISTVLVQEASGVKYYNEAGEEADLFQILADAGINYIRVRVWNDPYDENGKGYGGGNNDTAAAAEIGARAAKYGMKLCVDFHYSDFWADPAKQMVPKAWKGMSVDEMGVALYDFTKESLTTIIEAGADVGMVQIGNEINNGMSGTTSMSDRCALLAQGSKAVREIASEKEKEILVAVHLTNIEDQQKIVKIANSFAAANLDYDVFGVSYYPYWHGTMENLTDTLTLIGNTFGKKTAVLETAYAYTLEDGDGCGNSVDSVDIDENYAATVQSQATCIRDIMAATVAAGENALGVFYWEPAWTPVGPAEEYDNNFAIWEEKGSGWASSYSAEYDPDDAGKYYGGCAWDNQAMFDHEGHPLVSLNVFKYAKYGTICEPAVDFVKEIVAESNVGDAITLPDTVEAVYNNRELSGPTAVTWNTDELEKIDVNEMADHEIHGTLEDGSEVTATLRILKKNFVVNSSFEDGDSSMWKVTSATGSNPTDVQKKATDATSGNYSFHFWDEADQEFCVEQTVSGLSEGAYTLTVNMQGGDVGDAAEIVMYAIVNGVTYESDPVTFAGWCVWQKPVITDIPLDGASDIIIGARVKCAGGGWGTMDDFYLYKQ